MIPTDLGRALVRMIVRPTPYNIPSQSCIFNFEFKNKKNAFNLWWSQNLNFTPVTYLPHIFWAWLKCSLGLDTNISKHF